MHFQQIQFRIYPVMFHCFNCFSSEKDIAIYSHLRQHPGMRFFPFGFENYVIISRTEIREAGENVKPTIRLETETSLSLVDPEGFIGQKSTNMTTVKVGVQWKDGYVTDVRSFITATKWSAVSVISTMLLMLEKAYGFATRIYASVKSDREKKKIYKQNQQRIISKTLSNSSNTDQIKLHESPLQDNKRNKRKLVRKQRNHRFGFMTSFSPGDSQKGLFRDENIRNKYAVNGVETIENSYELGDQKTEYCEVRGSPQRSLQSIQSSKNVSQFDMMRIERNLQEINSILVGYDIRNRSGIVNHGSPDRSPSNGAVGIHNESGKPVYSNGDCSLPV